uniref:Uncharacterized protein n=1 Tax=Pelusios castaneus TaxID=367368 RepID=A0A8C8S372_9SAUR
MVWLIIDLLGSALNILLLPYCPFLSHHSKRAVTEHQFMHDKGRTLQGLKRLMWLHNAMGGVHTASARDASRSNSLWDFQKSQDLPDLYDNCSSLCSTGTHPL